MTGQLYFLEGNSLLELGYRTSSAGAVRVSRAAVGRL